jgi:hypothetical protein
MMGFLGLLGCRIEITKSLNPEISNRCITSAGSTWQYNLQQAHR